MVRRKDPGRGWRWLPAVVLAAAALVAGACGEDSPAQPEGPRAELVIQFDPNPAPFARPGQWEYTVTITEVNGVGLFIHEYLTRDYSAAGEPRGETVTDRQTFRTTFIECGGEGVYIPGGTSRCASIKTATQASNGFTEWEFRGQDDFGNEVIATARVTLL